MKTTCKYILFLSILSCSFLQEEENPDWSQAYDKQLGFKHKIYEEENNFLKAHEFVKEVKAQEDISCDSCIIGSSPAKYENFNPSKVYLLEGEGVDELGLENRYFDIPVVYNAAVKKWMKYFRNSGKKWFIRAAERAGRYSPILSDILNSQEMPRDLIFLSMAESGFQNHARSWASAVGPWQFIKGTGKKYGLKIDWYVDERKDPLKASLAASQYLKDLFQRFESWPLAMASYNAGEGKIARAIKRYNTRNFWEIRKGSYLARETKDYVPKIMALAIIGKNLRSLGFEEQISYQKKLKYDVLHLGKDTDLYKVASSLDMEFDELKRWNPELLRWQTPAWRDNYPLRLPVGAREDFDSCCEGMDLRSSDYKTLKTNRKRSVSSVAKEYKVSKAVLAQLNGTQEGGSFSANETIILPFKNSHSRWGKLYKDLYFKKRRRRKKGRLSMRRQISRAMQKGQKISNPSVFYTVKKGDNLWNISRKNGVSIHTLIRSNVSKLKNGSIFPGQKLVIR